MSLLIFADNHNGHFPKHTRELISYGRRMAEDLNTQAIVLVVGALSDEELLIPGKYGAHRMLTVDDPRFEVLDHKLYTSLIGEIVSQEEITHLLFSYSPAGKALAPLAAARLQAGYVSAVTGLPESYDPFIVRKMIFSGKVFASVEISTEKKVITLAPNAWKEEILGEAVEPEKISFKDLPQPVTDRLSLERHEGRMMLTDADIVISGGRGMQNADNFRLLEELAGLLGGAVACTRPVSDEGWRPPEEHAGQTGKIIAPDLYFAFGISGAIQHLAGVSGSKVIAAVNKDPDAPIFEAADYGIVGDALEVLPRLIDEVTKRKAGGNKE